MSKQNKVNKDHYVQGGRLTPDDFARARNATEQASLRAKTTERVTGKRRPAAAARASSRPRSAPEE